jgi:hypothetical protein
MRRFNFGFAFADFPGRVIMVELLLTTVAGDINIPRLSATEPDFHIASLLSPNQPATTPGVRTRMSPLAGGRHPAVVGAFPLERRSAPPYGTGADKVPSAQTRRGAELS